MKLTKEAQKVWDKFKRQGLSDDEIFERVPIWPHEYESEEEKKKVEKEFRKFRAEAKATMTQEDRAESERLRQKFIKEDNENEKY